MGILEKKKENGTEDIVEAIMIENFPKLMSDVKLQIQEGERTPSRINVPLNPQPFKFQKVKD